MREELFFGGEIQSKPNKPAWKSEGIH